MPEFIPEHIPETIDELAEPFIAGYFTAAEWLIRDNEEDPEGGIDKAEILCWSEDAIREAREDCARFERENADDLLLYQELSGRGSRSAGTDFWLSRNGHGAGFFDRGNDPVFDRLQDAAESYGQRDVYLADDDSGELCFQPG